MGRKKILLSSPTMHGEEMEYIKEAFDKNWIAPLGFNCDRFEERMGDYLGDEKNESLNCLAVSSGTAAIHLAIKLAGVKKGERVFCSDMTFSATVNPIVYEGGIPVFIDSEKDTWNMCPKALEKAFETYPDTRVVVLAHLYGVPAKMDEIVSICEKHNAILIEDAAEALSAEYHGRKCGTFGKYNILSFNGNKIITTSGGGMLVTDCKKARDKALFWATQSRENESWYEHKEIGYNYRMSNIVAGIGCGQLVHLDAHRDRKEAVYRCYEEGLKGLPLTMNPYMDGTKPNFWLSCILINEDCDVNVLDILKKLQDEDIESRPAWKPMHMQPVFAECDFICAGEKAVDEALFAKGLCLPSDIKMTQEDQQRVIEIIKSCF